MKINFVPVLILLIASCILFSCHKSADKPSTPPDNPSGGDSLLAWEKMGATIADGCADIWFVSSDHGFLLTARAAFESIDSGKSWTQIPNTIQYVDPLNLFFIGSQYGFVMTRDYVLISQDGGSSWTAKRLTGSTDNGGQHAYYIAFTSPATGFSSNTKDGLYRTADTAASWQNVFSDSIPSIAYPSFISADTGFLVTTAGSVAITGNGGLTWNKIPNDLSAVESNQPAFNQLQFLNSSIGYYGDLTGIHKSADGGKHWTTVLSKSRGFTRVIKFFDPDKGYFLAGNEIYKTLDGGTNWTLSCRVDSADNFVGMSFLNEHLGWACTSKGSVVRLNEK
ncbi:MAG TPA: YCF48-related protein [Puia sp.]|nr:YCF48-related protein [Puia sp.]